MTPLLPLLPLLAALAGAEPAAPANPAAPRVNPQAIAEGVELTQKAVRSGSDTSVRETGEGLQRLISGVSVVYVPTVHRVQRAQVNGEESTLENMLEATKKGLTTGAVPPAELRRNFETQQGLKEAKRMDVDGALDDDEMGIFRYLRGKLNEGRVLINPWLVEIGQLVGHNFAAATLFHEAAHADDSSLETGGVIEGEVVAFTAQYKWLKFIDPTGERLALLRVALAEQMKLKPNRLTKKAIDYAATLDVLVGTGGDPLKIRQFAYELGYREGEHRH